MAGLAAIYVASAAGALLGTTVGAVTAFVIGRRRHQRVAAIAGSVAGIAIGVVAGYYSDNLAVSWINVFSGNPLEGALAGGAIAGGLAGVAGAIALRTFQNLGAVVRHERKFAALSGSVLGLLAGLGGGAIGATLAQSVIACPNGYFSNPVIPSGCVPGVLQGSLLIGLWAGAATGALAAFLAASVLGRLTPDAQMAPVG